MRVAVIDIGSNTSKVLIAQKSNLGVISSIAEKSLPCRLAEGFGKGQLYITEKMINVAINVIKELFDFAHSFRPSEIKIVATEALRVTVNSKYLVRMIEQEFLCSVSILSGVKEAGYVAKGLMTDPLVSSINEFCALDLGGGSLEIMKVIHGVPRHVISLPLGAVVIAENFLGDLASKPSPSRIINLRNYILKILRNEVSVNFSKTSFLIGTGGSIVFLRKLICSSKQTDLTNQNAFTIPEIQRLSDKMNSMDLVDRILNFPELPRDRADIFPAAIILILELMKFLKVSNITHSFHNLRYGIADDILSN